MRNFLRFLLLACIFPSVTLRAEEADENYDPDDPNKIESSLATPAPTRYPDRYISLLREATRCFHARDFDGALRYADEADALIPPTPFSINLRGAIATELHQFEEGLKYFTEALKRAPGFFEARFNLCEIPFLQKNYAEARKGFMVLYEIAPKNELLIYRIYLTHLLAKDDEQAQVWKDKIPFPSETPAYHYANAAWEFAHDNETKAEEWLEAAEWVWPDFKRANFVDVLIQIGWVKMENYSKPTGIVKEPLAVPETPAEPMLDTPKLEPVEVK